MTLSLSLPTGVLGVGQVQGRVSKHGSLFLMVQDCSSQAALLCQAYPCWVATFSR